MSWRCVPDVCVLLFEVIGVLCPMYWCCLPEVCVSLLEGVGAILFDVLVWFARSMCVVV